jgi:signal transduction histidine kinase
MQNSNSQSDKINIQLASLLLHDLETPLAVTKQFLKRVKDGRHDPDNPNHCRLLDSAQFAIQRGERILEDLLDLTRAGANGFSVKCSHEDLFEIISQCSSIVLPLLNDKRNTVILPKESNCPRIVNLDKAMISRVIDNILVNAIRHASRASAIEILTASSDQTITLSIINEIEKDVQIDIARIFDPSYQVEMRIQRKMRGSGLGLTFSQMVIDAHGGKMLAHEEDGKAVIGFEIPFNGKGDING